jgi:hypothetical protein
MKIVMPKQAERISSIWKCRWKTDYFDVKYKSTTVTTEDRLTAVRLVSTVVASPQTLASTALQITMHVQRPQLQAERNFAAFVGSF